eukprot:TRINITY_DN50067_c0_g1_i1.p1 TRINITY_DN50067_c0_g1~~TRINITY_DN50067_c0_g1_i1.p1  ORF type:complete len:1031 (+),score=104.51 TRINITY_DN50067_c0_g1_i1:121-3213(+)
MKPRTSPLGPSDTSYGIRQTRLFRLPEVLTAALNGLSDEDLRSVVQSRPPARHGSSSLLPFDSRAQAVEAVVARRVAGRGGIFTIGELFASAASTSVTRGRRSRTAVPKSALPFSVRVLDEALHTRIVGNLSEIDDVTAVSKEWQTFSGAAPANRTLPEVWQTRAGSNIQRPPSQWCQSLLVPEAAAPSSERWRGVQPRSETVSVERVRGVVVSYMGQMLDASGTLYSETILKAEFLTTGSPELAFFSGFRNLSSLLFPFEPADYVRRHGLPAAMGEALEGLLFRELALYRGSRHNAIKPSVVDIRFPFVHVFPAGLTLVPLLDNSLLNYGHWISKGLSSLAALWSIVGQNESCVFLVYESPFILDTLHYLLGDAFARRVYRYEPRALYFAVEALVTGPEYFHHVDNLSRESGMAIRGLFLPPRVSLSQLTTQPRREFARVPLRLPLLLLLNRAELQTRGRSWANFQEVYRLVNEELGARHTVLPYICGDRTFHGQLTDFAETEIVVGIDGACFGNALWMPVGGVLVTIIPAKRNYIPIMPATECGYTYAWKFADVANLSTVAILLPDADANDKSILVPLALLRDTLRSVAKTHIVSRQAATPTENIKAILPGRGPSEFDVLRVYPIDLIYDAIDRGTIRVSGFEGSALEDHRRSMALYKRYLGDMNDQKKRDTMVQALGKKCITEPGCGEDHLVYYTKLLEKEQQVAMPQRARAVRILNLRRALLQQRPRCAFYLFGMAEQLEAVGSMDENATLLLEAAGFFEAALLSDAEVGVLEETARYKAWELLVGLHVAVGSMEVARQWIRRAQASGYPWHDLYQLPYQRMFHPRFLSKPVWDCDDTEYLSYLCSLLSTHHDVIRKEFFAALTLSYNVDGIVSFTESTSLVARGNWTQIKLAGDDPVTKAMVWREDLCSSVFIQTCRVLRTMNAHHSAMMGTAKFYVMAPGTVLKPHCGQANLRLFLQLGVSVPQGVILSAGGEEHRWREGEVLILDDSFIHSVRHSGSETRVTLSIPVWHPDIYHRFANSGSVL